jgi:hypothetical protein
LAWGLIRPFAGLALLGFSPYLPAPQKNKSMNTYSRFARAALIVALAGLGVVAQAATLESYFDFTRYESIRPGATLVSNVHGKTPAILKSTGTTLNQWGLTIEAGHSAADTGVLIAGDALAAYSGDFTIQIWFITSETVSANTMLFGGTTSAGIDESLAGDKALFVGYNHVGEKTEFLRPVVSDGNRWGLAMTAAKGTGVSLITMHDYVLTYNRGSRRMAAYMNGVPVGSLNSVNLDGLAVLTKGMAIGGVESSAFRDDASAPVNIRSFLLYSGALSSKQVAKLHESGPSLGLDAVRAAEVVVK